MRMANNFDVPILHVVVIGFHHKKGSQVEYSYPALVEGQPVDSNEVPPIWKHLPSLALPDGAHNHDKDTVYFHLPSKQDEHSTVYGVSCYRQIDAKDVRNKGSEVTRNSIQKAVCVLSRLPLFGLIEVKLEMITYAWFKEKDFTQVSILEETYRQLSASCNEGLLEGSQVFLGLSCRELVAKLRHKIVMVFKLLLLERKVLVYGSPAKPVCSTVISLLSLFPDLLEYGLKESAAYSMHRVISPTMKNVRVSGGSEEFLEIHYTESARDGVVATPGKVKAQPHHAKPSQDLQNANIQRGESCAAQGQQEVELSHDALKADQSDQCKSSHKINALTPSPVCEKSECELPEKLTDSPKKDPVDSDNKNDLSLKGLSAVESHTLITDDTLSISPDKTIQSCDKTDAQKDRHSQSPQNNDVASSENCDDFKVLNTGLPYVQGHSHFAAKNDVIDMPQAVSKDTITSEGTASDFGTASNMEELLENEECFSWRDDRLTLAIGSDLTGSAPREIEGKLSFDVEDSAETKRENDSPTKMTRMDSTTSRASQGSITSMASDLGEAGVKILTDLKGRFSSIWDGSPVEGQVEEEIPQVHHLETHQSQAGETDEEKSPTKGGSSTSQKASSPKRRTPSPSTCRSPSPTTLTTDECGFPLAIFTKSVLCHPYLSLQYYDLLQDVNVRGFLIGASNMLFRQKKHLIDVVIELPDLTVEVHDEALRRQLALSTADLRFADFLVKSVCDENAPGDMVFYEDTEWEGGDEWLRGQFKLYLASLLVTLRSNDEKLMEDFNPVFVQAFKTSSNYKLWKSVERRGLKEAPPGHPFQGQLSMHDIRMRFAQYERGKKIIDVAGQTGKVAVQTGKVIGGALTTAKSAVSSTVTGWFSSIKKWSSSDSSPVDDTT